MRSLILATLALTALTPAAAAEARPPLCAPEVIESTLIGAGHLTQDDLDADMGVNLVRCGDLTGDGGEAAQARANALLPLLTQASRLARPAGGDPHRERLEPARP